MLLFKLKNLGTLLTFNLLLRRKADGEENTEECSHTEEGGGEGG